MHAEEHLRLPTGHRSGSQNDTLRELECQGKVEGNSLGGTFQGKVRRESHFEGSGEPRW